MAQKELIGGAITLASDRKYGSRRHGVAGQPRPMNSPDGVGETYYPLSIGIAKVIEKSVSDTKITIETTGGGMENGRGEGSQDELHLLCGWSQGGMGRDCGRASLAASHLLPQVAPRRNAL